jgi:hypothetical protein
MTLLFATIIHVIAATAIARIETFHSARTDMDPVNHWLHEEVFHPLLRAVVLLLFMLLAYRGIYGLGSNAPGLGEIWNIDLIVQGMNLLFMLPFIIALLPHTATFTPLLVPLQTLALTAIVFHHLATAMGISITLLPSAKLLPTLILLVIATHFLVRWLARHFPARWQHQLRLYDLGLVVFQLPLFLAYGRSLGQQLGS